MKLGEGFIEVRADRTAFDGDLSDLARRIRSGQGGAGDVSSALRDALVGTAFLAGSKKAIDAASQLEQAVGGTSAVFGESASAIDRWSKDAAEAAGLSERAARELTSQIGGLLKGFGFTEQAAADLSIQLALLGADLAATFGGKPEEAVQALAAALRGETDPIERYGIALNQTLVNQRAVALGLAESTSKVDQHAKAQATLSLITERSADAQGQFAREADTAAGQAAISAAKTENAAADLGENLLPIYTKLAEVVGIVADAFGALPEPVQTALIALAGIAALTGPVKAGAEALSSLATIARTQLTRGLDTAASGAYTLAGNLGKVTVGLGALGGAVALALNVWEAHERRARLAEEATRDFADAIREADDAAEGTAAHVAEVVRETPKLAEILDEAGVKSSGLAAALSGSNDEWEAMRGRLLDAAGALGITESQLPAVTYLLDGLRTSARTAAEQVETEGRVVEDAGNKAATAAPKVEDLAEKLDVNEQAAKDAAESVDLFREAVEKALQPLDFEEAVDSRTQALADMAADIEARAKAVEDARQRIADIQEQRDESATSDARAIADAEERLAEARARNADTDAEREARARAIADAEEALARARADADDGGSAARELADAQAALDEAIAATSLTLEGNSDAALRNREQVRGLIDESIGVIEAAREQGRSLDDLKLIREGEIQNLERQLTQMGFNREEIAKYIGAIEAIPITKATTLTVDTAKAQARVKDLADSLNAIAPNTVDAAVIDRNLQRAANELSRAEKGYAAGGFPFDGDFLVHADEILRKRGADLEVIAGPTPTPLDSGGDMARVESLLRELVSSNLLIAGNTAGPTTSTRLRRIQTTAGAI